MLPDPGEEFVLERLEGQGTAGVELAGEITSYDPAAGQSRLVHPGHVGLFQDTVSFEITRMQGIPNAHFGGDAFTSSPSQARAPYGCKTCRCPCWPVRSLPTPPAKGRPVAR